MLRKNETIIGEQEADYLVQEYLKIDYEASSMQDFLSAIWRSIRNNIPLDKNTSVLDIGCGRGYFLKYLKENNVDKIIGIDPCTQLIDNKVFSDIYSGCFEDNSFTNNEFDIVFTCHTLHHLKEKYPVEAVREMLRIAKKYVAIIEINNTNIPMLLKSLIKRKVELNAICYSTAVVKDILNELKCRIIYSGNLKCCYVSGNSVFYRFLSRLGTLPYNIIIAEKGGDS